MCGISGQLYFRGDTQVKTEDIRRMANTIRHRGPDDEGIFISGEVGLGFRRLSIIDLAGGHQPMSDESGSIWVAFNGEIYNFKELRSQLEALGHSFRTRSDTEVIVHGYREWGPGVLGRLNGMFGLAVWDEGRRRLVLARDAMGIKPLYYHLADGKLIFGSEIRAVLAGMGCRPGLDAAALAQFLQLRYTPSPRTMYEGIRKLAPGTMLVCEAGNCREMRWYEYAPKPFGEGKDVSEAWGELLELYGKAMKRHLLSDVPVGLLLSGGVDSGLLLALMNEHGEGWPAYTAGYGETFEDDELADAAESAKLMGARHIPVRLDRLDFEGSLPKIVDALEEPVASSSIVPMYFVCQRAREDVKVVLMGQGPDELFGGYKRHVGVHYGGRWRKVPPGLRRLAGRVVEMLPRQETLKRGIRSLGVEDRLERYRNVFSLAPDDLILGLFQDGVVPGEAGYLRAWMWEGLRPQMRELDELGGFQHLEVRSSLPDELLMYADKLSMAHGLEARVPYLDREVVEYAQRIPSWMKVRNGLGKRLHREVCQRRLHGRILRRKKRGFAVNVVDSWFQKSMKGALPEMLMSGDSMMFELLDANAVRALLRDHGEGRQDHHKLLFSLVMVEQWLRCNRERVQTLLPAAAA